tara:strand:+ start:705 stop:1577 length:873 start_codon:yes stop_codon:yes gene_type:complete
MRILMLFFVIFSFSVHSQHSYIPKKTDQNFYNYLKNKFEPEFLIQKNKKRKFSENFIFGKIHETCTLLNLNKINSFSISYPGKENKFLAAILHGISNNSTYEFLADDYEQYSSSKSILFKEFLKIKIQAIPDTTNMKAIRKYDINRLERITQFNHNDLIQLKSPIIVSYYTTHIENYNGIEKSSKIIIKHNDKIIYSSISDGYKNKLVHEPKMNEFIFMYKLKNQKKIIWGGLMNHFLTNFLCKKKDIIHLNAMHISKVSDIHNNNIKDLKRVYSKGILKQSMNPLKLIL